MYVEFLKTVFVEHLYNFLAELGLNPVISTSICAKMFLKISVLKISEDFNQLIY